MRGRVALSGMVAIGMLAAAPSALPARDSARAVPTLPAPALGNITIARFTIASTGAGASTVPRLRLESRKGLSARDFVVALVGRTSQSGRFAATVAVVRPTTPSAKSQAPQAATPVQLRLPAGFQVAGSPQVVRDVLYENKLPEFALATSGTASVVAGVPPSKLPLARIVADAQLLALDRSIPLVDAGVLGLPFVAAQFSKPSGRTISVTIGLTGLSQVNAVEVRFPAGVKVTRVAGPAGTSTTLVGPAAQLIATSSFFQVGLPYTFRLELSGAPRKGTSVAVRASTHYFESALPFTERFFLS